MRWATGWWSVKRGRTTSTYDAANQLETSVDGTGTTTYTYDDVGNPTQVDEGGGNTVDWKYDDTDRLINEKRSGTGSFNTTYTYDAVGNWLIDCWLKRAPARTSSTVFMRRKWSVSPKAKLTNGMSLAAKQVSSRPARTIGLWGHKHYTAIRMTATRCRMRCHKPNDSSA